MPEATLTIGQTNLDVFAKTVMELAEHDRNLLLLTSDSRGSGRVTPFANRFPKQIVELGIAEQNLVGVSAGLAAAGKKVFVVSPACFLTARALEQIKNDVAYSDHPVKVVGISAGVSYGSLGTTHHSLHDYAVLQAIHNIDIVSPADNFETVEAVRAAAKHPRPIYIRFGKKPMPVCHRENAEFRIGKAIQLTPEREEYDAALIATGEAVTPAFQAAGLLSKNGVTSCVLSTHTLRPFDVNAVREAALKSRVVMTVEEHSIHGGLGSRVASFLMQEGIFRPIRIMGIPDEHIITGSQSEVFNHYGLSAPGLAEAALALLAKAGRP
jgi:transketolase